jgi:perosamine synthetase
MRNITVGDWRCTPEEKELVNQVLDSGRLSYGPVSRQLEQGFAAVHGVRYGVLSNSGTSSLQVALQAMKEHCGWEDGDEVIVPALTFVATANIVLHNRMKPVLVDVEPDMYGIDVDKIADAITPRTKAIIPVHLFGMPCDMEGVWAVARAYGLAIIEDSCETMFAHHRGKYVWGDIACYSFYMAHLITAGVGGIAITDDPDLAVTMRSLVNHGRDSIYLSTDDDNGLSDEKLKEVIARRFNFVSVGHSYRVTEVEAALALAQLHNREDMLVARRQNAAFLNITLHYHREHLQLPTLRYYTGHAWMMYPIVTMNDDKVELVNYLEGRGIETRDMLPLTNQPAYAGWLDRSKYPVAEYINDHGFYIGCHQYLTPDDLVYIAETFDDYYQREAAGCFQVPISSGATRA